MELHLVSIEQIKIPAKRYRKEFDPLALSELANSIQSTGLLQPIVLRKVNGDWELVCGERRMRAAQIIWDTGGEFRHNDMGIPANMMPAVNHGDLPPLLAKIAEWEENFQREPLTWQESANATTELKSLREQQALEEGRVPPTVADIAEEIKGTSEGKNQETIRRELIVAEHLGDPEVAKSKNLEDAFKVLKRKENLKKHEQLSREVGRTFNAAQHRLERGDCLELLKTVPSESFDVILTDPPYGIGANEFADGGGAAPGGGHLYEDSEQNWNALMLQLPFELSRIAKPQAHCYIFCDVTKFEKLKALMTPYWRVFRTPLIWHKPDGNRIPWINKGPQRKWEMCLFAVKGEKLVQKTLGDVLVYPADEYLGHQAQKPVGLFTDLLKRSCQPGDTVIDPFCGSGTIFPAAHEVKVKATGFEPNEAAYGIAVKRLQELK